MEPVRIYALDTRLIAPVIIAPDRRRAGMMSALESRVFKRDRRSEHRHDAIAGKALCSVTASSISLSAIVRARETWRARKPGSIAARPRSPAPGSNRPSKPAR
jgi:hypothetical protein